MDADEIRFTVRLPGDLSGKLDDALHDHKLSRNAAIIKAVAQWLEPEDVRLTVRKREELASAGPPSRDSYGMPTNGNGGAPEDEAPAGPMVLDKLRRLR